MNVSKIMGSYFLASELNLKAVTIILHK